MCIKENPPANITSQMEGLKLQLENHTHMSTHAEGQTRMHTHGWLFASVSLFLTPDSHNMEGFSPAC